MTLTPHRTSFQSRIARLGAIAAIPAFVFAVSACSSGSGSSSGSASPTSSASASGSTALVTTSLNASEVVVTGGGATQPQVQFPTPSSASALSTKDTKVGTGATVKAGATVELNYMGIGAITGQVFDSSWESGKPISFSLAQLIPGWQEGIPGMKVGGQRVLVIPAAKAYGSNPPRGILSNESLVFVVEILGTK